MFLHPVIDRIRSIGKGTISYVFTIMVIGVAGILVRTIPYLHNRSLWLDEAYLAMNILDRSFNGLLKPLDFNQGAPLGFLIATKALVKIFGTSEYVLRIIPFISGILTIGLFLVVARRFLGPKALLAALFLLSFSPAMVYYSSEFKQYGSDALICLALFALSLLYLENDKIWIKVALGLGGIIAMFFSHPAVFVMAGTGLTLAGNSIHKKDLKNLLSLVVIGFLWLVSFAVLYAVSLNSLSNNNILQDYWASDFAPFPPRSVNDVIWYLNAFLRLFELSAQIPLKGLAFFCFILGGVAIYQDRKAIFFLLFAPILFVMLASIFHFYPFSVRLLTFLIPTLLLLIIKGIAYLSGLVSRDSFFVPVLLFTLIAIHPTYSVVQTLQKPKREEINSVIQFVQQNWQEGDLIYVYYASEIPFRYYDRVRPIPVNHYVFGVPSQNWEIIRKDLEKYKGIGRLWFLFSHARGDDIKVNLYFLRNMGKEIQSFQEPGASVYLFDLKKP